MSSMSGSSKLIKSQVQVVGTFLAVAHGMWDPSPPTMDEPESSQWKCGVLTTGLTTREVPCGYI